MRTKHATVKVQVIDDGAATRPSPIGEPAPAPGAASATAESIRIELAQAWGEIDTMIGEQAPAIPWVWDYNAGLRSENVNAVVNLFNGSADLTFTSIDQGE